MDLSSIERWASAHHGLITLAHLDERDGEGTRRRPELPSRSAYYRALKSGQLDEVHPGVARLRGAPTTREQLIAAAVLAIPGSMASHRSSAHLWGVERPADEVVDVIGPRIHIARHLEGVIVHRPSDRLDLTPSTRSAIRTTNPLRMLCDLAAVDPGSIARAVETVMVEGYATPTVLRELVARHGRRGRQGIVALRDAVRQWPLGDKPADSVLEPAMARLLAANGLPSATFHERILGYEVDFRIDGTPIVLECDGWEYHVKSREQWMRDCDRDAALLAGGYATVRFTWEHLTRRAAWTARRIRSVLQRWAPTVLMPSTPP
jgi:very-short-patch-repair endonuclease